MRVNTILTLLICLSNLLLAQVDPTILGLKGVEDNQGNSHLVYEAKHADYHNWDPRIIGKSVNSFNPISGEDTLLLHEWNQYISHGINYSWIFDNAVFWQDSLKILISGIDYGQWGSFPGFLWQESNFNTFRFDDSLRVIFDFDIGITSAISIINTSSTNNQIFLSFFYYYETTPTTYLPEEDLLLSGTIISNSLGWDWEDNESDTTYYDYLTRISTSINRHIPFYTLSLSPHRNLTMFGLDTSLNLIKSLDGGNTSSIVDENKYWDMINIDFYYDKSQNTIFVLSKKSDIYYLLKSDEFGEPGSWQLLRQSSNEINFTINDSVSGEAYYSLGNTIYKTEDYGINFRVFDKLDQNITGLYKKPDSDILYISTPYYIYERNNSEMEITKSVSADKSLGYYPLAINNKWSYHVSGVAYNTEPDTIDYIMNKAVIKDTTFSNNETYFETRVTYSHISRTDYIYERIDSTAGKIYQAWENDQGEVFEEVKFNFKKLPGDTVYQFVEFYQHPVNTLYADFDIDIYEKHILGVKRFKAWYDDYYELVDKIGLYSYTYTFDFGYENCELLGAYVNGNYFGDTLMVNVDNNPIEQPAEFHLSQNYPNPFNPTTTIEYTIPVGDANFAPLTSVKLGIYDILGREVAILVNEQQKPGKYSVEFDARKLPSGIYFYSLNTGKYSGTRKMLLLK